MSTKVAKELSLPFPLHALCYPSRVGQLRTSVYNFLFNRLYPVRPWVFASALTGSFWYYRCSVSDASRSVMVLRLIDKIPIVCRFPSIGKLLLAALLSSYAPVAVLRALLRQVLFSYKRFLYEPPKSRSALTKLWAVCWWGLRRVAPPRLESTNGLLPALPVPALSDTVKRYLQSMRPMMAKNEFSRLESLAVQFLSAEGRKLQLYTHLYSLCASNYVTPLWERYIYLAQREPLLINSSVGFVDIAQPPRANQAVRAAHLIYVAAANMLALAEGGLAPPGEGMVFAGHYRRLFATVRLPGKFVDRLVSRRLSRHIAVYYDGAIYKMEVFAGENEGQRLYSVEELTEAFMELICNHRRRREHSEVVDDESHIAALTHDRRDRWEQRRALYFLPNPTNAASLAVIESAMVFLTLDSASDIGYSPDEPAVLDRTAKRMLTGTGADRWPDLALNFVVAANGAIGGNCEHSVGDGAEFDHLIENFLHVDRCFLAYPTVVVDLAAVRSYRPGSGVRLAERLEFDLDATDMRAEIRRCYREHQLAREDVDLAVLVDRGITRSRIKRTGCAPDAFIQMCLQLANYRDQGRFSLTYEAASARFYTNSRTETLRTVSEESCAFVRAMQNKQAKSGEKKRLLRSACSGHFNRNRDAMTGRGIDRHLFVLYVMSRATGTPSGFLQHFATQKWLLSTSQPPNMTGSMGEERRDGDRADWAWLGANFAAVAKEGYGVCYRFLGETGGLVAHVASYKSAVNTVNWAQRMCSLVDNR